MVRKKKKKKKKKEIESLPQKEVEINIPPLEENQSCEDIESDYCEEIVTHTFSKDPQDLFIEVKYIEDRFQDELRTYNAEWIKKIQDLQDKKDKEYQNIIKNRKKSLQKNVEEIAAEIEKNIDGLKAQERMILSEIDILYQMNLDKLVDLAFETMGLTFIAQKTKNNT
ncbi:MAG: hypothetical protein ACTSWW_03175 [Promethearchaeota archaeon]